MLESLGLDWEALFVDDGSQDGSRDILEESAAREPRIRLIELVRNFGGQAALCAGFSQVRGGQVVCLDADLENLPEDIPNLLAPLEQGYDLVCGYRENRQSSLIRRRLPSILLNAYVKRIIRRSVRDIGCGMRAMDASVVRNLDAEGERRRMLSPLLLSRSRRVAEVPIRHGAAPWPGGHTFLTLAAIAVDFWMVSSLRPFLLIALIAAVTSASAFVFASIAFFYGHFEVGLVAWVTFLAFGLVFAIGILGEFIGRLYELAQGKPFYVIREPSVRASEH